MDFKFQIWIFSWASAVQSDPLSDAGQGSERQLPVSHEIVRVSTPYIDNFRHPEDRSSFHFSTVFNKLHDIFNTLLFKKDFVLDDFTQP